MIHSYSFLSQALRAERLSHAYLVTSGNNVFSKELINWFAGALFCDNVLYKEEDCSYAGCRECRACRLVQNGGHPDLNIVNSVDGSVKIAQIRQLKNSVYFRPVMSKWKLAAIVDAHSMTEEAAQSILKILEEPPSYMVFVLTAPHYSTLLPTIVSRCQLILSDDTAACNDGAAIPLLVQQVLSVISLLHDDSNKTTTVDLLNFSEPYETQKGEREQFLNLFAKWYWDMARFLTGANPLGINGDSTLNQLWINTIEKYGKHLSQLQVITIHEAILQTLSGYNKNANWRLLLDILFLKINKITSVKREFINA